VTRDVNSQRASAGREISPIKKARGVYEPYRLIGVSESQRPCYKKNLRGRNEAKTPRLGALTDNLGLISIAL
jgi:hypothetical protein